MSYYLKLHAPGAKTFFQVIDMIKYFVTTSERKGNFHHLFFIPFIGLGKVPVQFIRSRYGVKMHIIVLVFIIFFLALSISVSPCSGDQVPVWREDPHHCPGFWTFHQHHRHTESSTWWHCCPDWSCASKQTNEECVIFHSDKIEKIMYYIDTNHSDDHIIINFDAIDD